MTVTSLCYDTKGGSVVHRNGKKNGDSVLREHNVQI
jgi:hypothetical protein